MTKDSVFIIFFLIFAIFSAVFIFNGGYIRKSISCGSYQTEEISIGLKVIKAAVSDDDCKRTLGLSGRKEIDQSSGMLFVFDDEAPRGIWMKDMAFPIDVFWRDAQGQIVSEVRDMATSSYPDVFYPSVPATYVLETDAGFAAANAIATGTSLQLLNVPNVSN